MKSKLIKIYVDRRSSAIFIRATKPNQSGKGFILRDASFGKAVGKNVSDAELGKFIRQILQNCL